MTQHTPPALDHPDAVRRLAAILKHAAQLRRNTSIAVEEVVVSYAGTEWRIDPDGDGREWWTDTVTGTRYLGDTLTQTPTTGLPGEVS